MKEFMIELLGDEAHQTDLDAINEINREQFGQKAMTMDYCTNNILNNPWVMLVVAREPVSRKIVSKQTLYLIPLDDGTMKGLVEQVATAESHKRRGLAKKISKVLFAIAEGVRGVKYTDLTSSDDKQAAHQLYLDLGFVERQTNNFRRVAK